MSKKTGYFKRYAMTLLFPLGMYAVFALITLIIGNAEDLQNYQNYVVPENGADGCVTAEELENCIISYNADATLADLNTLPNRSLSDIVAARQ